ncbi:MAG: hypothetical protein K1X75_06160 [Leptospirales bacterium]|nr:hypothetical protein [Leptospirales bacterium]
MTHVVNFGRGVREAFGDSYDDFVQGLNEIAKNQEIDVVRQVEERFHRVVLEAKTELRDEISQVRVELKEEISQVRVELKEEISEVRVELARTRGDLETRMAQLDARIAALHVSQLRWMFLFWIGQVGATVAIISLLLRH